MSEFQPKCIRFNPPEPKDPNNPQGVENALTTLAIVNVDPEKDQHLALKLTRMGYEFRPSHIKGQKKPGWIKRLPAGLCLEEETALKKQLNIHTQVYVEPPKGR